MTSPLALVDRALKTGDATAILFAVDAAARALNPGDPRLREVLEAATSTSWRWVGPHYFEHRSSEPLEAARDRRGRPRRAMTWAINDGTVRVEDRGRTEILVRRTFHAATAEALAIGALFELDAAAEERASRLVKAGERRPDRPTVGDVRRRWHDPWSLVTWLGLDQGAKRSPRGALVRCPAHEERHPSCSVFRAEDTIGVRCHACGWTADVIGLIAQVRGYRLPHELPRLLEDAR